MSDTTSITERLDRPPQRVAAVAAAPWKVLVVGQTPPPYHGQGIMLQMLVSARFESLEIRHVRMAFSKNMDEVGRFQFLKLFHLVGVIARIYAVRIRHGAEALYYPPAGPHRVPIWRDFVILGCTRWLFRKTIFHMHASGLSEIYPRLNVWERWFFRRAYFHPDAVIRSSEFTPEDGKLLRARREFVVATGTTEVAPPESPPREINAGPAPAEVATQVPRILYLATVCRTKGILVLLDACQRLAARGREFRLEIVGSYQPAEFENEVRARIRDHGLDARTTIWGQQIGADKVTRFREADLFCFPTFYESEAFPCVLVEALSYGLPVVSTRWRGIPSIVSDGKEGILIAPQSPEALGLALEELISNPDERRRMGQAGRRKYLDQFTPEAHLEAMEQVFQAVRSGAR